MKNVLFLCAAGMSTSLLVNKTMDAVRKQGKEEELSFSAREVASAPQSIPKADCVLLGPQVRFQLAKLQKQFPDKKIAVIPPQAYGLCDGPAIIKMAEELLAE